MALAPSACSPGISPVPGHGWRLPSVASLIILPAKE